jgi:NADH-quinone oxidoreductase subunit M
MVNHGLSTGALFLMVGMLYERTHTRQMSYYGGVLKVLPAFSILSLIILLSSMGLPGLNGFVGEFTILLGAYKSTIIGSPWFAGVATVGVILAAVYLLHMYEKVFLGKGLNDTVAKLEPVSIREYVVLIPLLVMIFWIGLYPKPFFELLNPTVNQLLEVFTSAGLF